MSRNWRQVRVFTSNFGATWYHEILARIVIPWLAHEPNTDFFFSKYLVPFGLDDADTEPAQLAQQQRFLQRTPQGLLHRSIRIRFVEPPAPANVALPGIVAGLGPGAGPVALAQPPPSPKEVALDGLIRNSPQNFWASGFLDYILRNDLGGDRFSPFPAAQEGARDERGEAIAAILQANCRLVLKLFDFQAGHCSYEQSVHLLNQAVQTPVQSIAHMLGNVWFNGRGESVELWAFDRVRGIKMKV